MSIFARRSRRGLSTSERTIVVIHLLIALAFGIVGLFGATDPEWGDLQRFVVMVFVGLWLFGVLVVGVLTRFVVNQRARYLILLTGPVLAIVLVLGWIRIL